MDKQVDARFERVEKALTTLVDSITKYNPSVGAANDLSLAERELARGLQEVQTHQTNHLRLLQLRAATGALDAQMRETLVSLATTRKELIATPETKFPDDDKSYRFTYPELLGYARRISKTSMPCMGASLEGIGLDRDGNVLPGADGAATTGGGASGPQPQPQMQHQPTNGATTAATALPNGGSTGSLPLSQPASQTQTQTLTPTATPQTNTHTTSTPLHPLPPSSSSPPLPTLPEVLFYKANPFLNSLFTPFPSQPIILSGCLVANQLLSESGIDPKNHDPVAEAEAERVRQEEAALQAEKERVEREEESRRIRLEREEQMKRRAAELVAEREKKEKEERMAEEERRRLRIDGGVGGPGAAGAATAPGSAISPTSERIGAKGEFKFVDDLDDED